MKREPAAARRRIEIYDTTLRDGTQGLGFNLSLEDKLAIARELDLLGVDYIEGGYPLSNPKDVAFFREIKNAGLRRAKIAAFGMTRRKGIPASEDPGMIALVESQAPAIALVGKTSDFHVREVLQVSLDENLAMIRESVLFLVGHGCEVIYDAEQFFDGFKRNADYALNTLKAAADGGARLLCLCDTNGGTLPHEMTEIIDAVQAAHLGAQVGVHLHNDSGVAVANALTAVERGAVQVQGTINSKDASACSKTYPSFSRSMTRSRIRFSSARSDPRVPSIFVILSCTLLVPDSSLITMCRLFPTLSGGTCS